MPRLITIEELPNIIGDKKKKKFYINESNKKGDITPCFYDHFDDFNISCGLLFQNMYFAYDLEGKCLGIYDFSGVHIEDYILTACKNNNCIIINGRRLLHEAGEFNRGVINCTTSKVSAQEKLTIAQKLCGELLEKIGLKYQPRKSKPQKWKESYSIKPYENINIKLPNSTLNYGLSRETNAQHQKAIPLSESYHLDVVSWLDFEMSLINPENKIDDYCPQIPLDQIVYSKPTAMINPSQHVQRVPFWIYEQSANNPPNQRISDHPAAIFGHKRVADHVADILTTESAANHHNNKRKSDDDTKKQETKSQKSAHQKP